MPEGTDDMGYELQRIKSRRLDHSLSVLLGHFESTFDSRDKKSRNLSCSGGCMDK